MTITPFLWGPEQLVNTETTSGQGSPDVAVLANGNYVVTWTDDSGIGADTSGAGIKAQMYNAAGDPIGGEFLVNSTTLLSQTVPTVTGLANGDFVVAWQDRANTEWRYWQ